MTSPWVADLSVDGDRLLTDIADFVRRLVALPSEDAVVAMALWAAHAHAIDCFESSPRIAFLSPEPASGKTRCLEVLETLTPYPMMAVNSTPAALFRAVSDLERRPTILFDEIDSVFGPKAKEHEELRGLLNAGHRRSGSAYRCVGEGTRQRVVKFPAYAALAMAGLGDLPATLMSRSVVIRMRRRSPAETVEPFRQRVHEPEGFELRDRLALWLEEKSPRLIAAWPVLPDGLIDRQADCWEPLIAVGDAAGGAWPQRSRDAALALTRSVATTTDASLGVLLLSHLRITFEPLEAVLPTAEILERLLKLEEAPWSDLKHGKALDARGLAWRLRQYGIASTKVKVGGRSLQGYRRDDLEDTWARYLSPSAEVPEPPEPSRSDGLFEVPYPVLVPEPRAHPEPSEPALTWEVPEVPELRQGERERRCAHCRLPLDPLLAALGDSTHPGCGTEETTTSEERWTW